MGNLHWAAQGGRPRGRVFFCMAMWEAAMGRWSLWRLTIAVTASAALFSCEPEGGSTQNGLIVENPSDAPISVQFKGTNDDRWSAPVTIEPRSARGIPIGDRTGAIDLEIRRKDATAYIIPNIDARSMIAETPRGQRRLLTFRARAWRRDGNGALQPSPQFDWTIQADADSRALRIPFAQVVGKKIDDPPPPDPVPPPKTGR